MDDKKPISLENLKYYFDAKEKDVIDGGGFLRRSREVLALRDRLRTLSDKDFEAAIKAMKNIVANDGNAGEDKPSTSQRKDATRLYEEASQASSTPVGKITPV